MLPEDKLFHDVKTLVLTGRLNDYWGVLGGIPPSP